MRAGIGVLKQRGVVAALVAVAGTAAVGVAAAAGSSAQATDVTIYTIEDNGTPCFSTSQTTCNGDVQVALNGATNKVTFVFPGNPANPGNAYSQPHNAASSSTNWSYESHAPSQDPAAVEDPDFDFTTNGTYTFHCDAHPFQMKGTITVTGATDPTTTATSTATATPTASTQPSDPNTNTPPPTGGTADAVKPTLRSIGASAKGRAVKVKFRLSENATVTIRVKRGSKLVKSVTKQLAAGNRSVSVRSAKKLKKGRYKIEVRARDASGNVSTLASKTFRVKQ